MSAVHVAVCFLITLMVVDQSMAFPISNQRVKEIANSLNDTTIDSWRNMYKLWSSDEGMDVSELPAPLNNTSVLSQVKEVLYEILMQVPGGLDEDAFDEVKGFRKRAPITDAKPVDNENVVLDILLHFTLSLP